MTDKQIIDILSNNEMFNQVGLLSYVFRGIGWGLIKLMAFLANNIENVVNKIYSLNGFFSSKYVDELLHKLFPITWGILAIAVLFLGFKIMFNRDFKLNGLVKNILISISIVMLLPLGMSQLSKITNAAIGGLKSEYKFSADKIVKDNVYDLYYLDTVNFKPKTTLKNKIPVNAITAININEEIDSSKLKNKDICNSKISIDKNGKKVKDELKKGIFNLFPENYYRYSFKFWTIAISIGCITFTLLITSIKIARIIFELGFIKLFGILYSVADISTGQKNKEIIRCIVSNFVVLFVISVLLKLYLLFSAWSTESSKGVVQIVLLIGASLAVIDGPNIVERILGIDCGIKGGWNTITGINSAFNTIAQASHGISKIMGSAVNGMASVGSGAVGMYNGFKEGMKPLEEQMNDEYSNDLGEIFDKKDDTGNSEQKEQTSLHDEMESQDNSSEITDSSQNSNIQEDSEAVNISNLDGANVNNNLNSNSENDVDTNVGTEDNKNNNLDMKQDAESNLSSNIDAKNTSSRVSNPTLDSEINKSNIGNYQGSYSSQSNASGDKGNVKSEKNISANENNNADNSRKNNSLENEMANITDNSKNNTTLENEMKNISDASIDNPTGTEIGNIVDAPIDNPTGTEIGSIVDAPIDNPTGTEIGSIADAPIDNPTGIEIGSIADTPIDNSTGTEIGNIADTPIDNSTGTEIGNIADTPIDNSTGTEIGNISNAPINDITGSKMGSTKDTPINDTIGSTEKHINNSSIEGDMKNSKSSIGTENKTSSSSNVDITQNEGVKNQRIENVKSPVEHRTLSEHIKHSMQENSTVRSMQQSYSIGRNTGMKMASLIRNRKNKKNKE